MSIAYDIINLFLPRYCAVCGDRLPADDHVLCSRCIDRYYWGGVYEDFVDNPMTRSLYGQVKVERANALFRYVPHGHLAQMIYMLKYGNRPDVALFLGQWAARQLMTKGFFNGIDIIVPVPLTDKRLRWRGYNQSELLAKGIGNLTGIPVATGVVRRQSFQVSQTHLRHWERKHNVETAFRLVNAGPVKGKHVLLVDDVFTTGATMTACAKTLAGDFLSVDLLQQPTRVSVLTMALAGDLPIVVDDEEKTGLDYFNFPSPLFSPGIDIFASQNLLEDMETTATVYAEKLLDIEAIRLSPEKPFSWASGWLSPIYCDNRKTLGYPEIRTFVKTALCQIVRDHFPQAQAVAGVATGAIAQGALVADALSLPFVYVRSKPKDHGMGNLIEGDLPEGTRVVVIEDLISTGSSSLAAVAALRAANCMVVGMAASFTYGFPVADEAFREAGVKLVTISDYSHVVDTAVQRGYIQPDIVHLLCQWRENPDQWGTDRNRQ